MYVGHCQGHVQFIQSWSIERGFLPSTLRVLWQWVTSTKEYQIIQLHNYLAFNVAVSVTQNQSATYVSLTGVKQVHSVLDLTSHTRHSYTITTNSKALIFIHDLDRVVYNPWSKAYLNRKTTLFLPLLYRIGNRSVASFVLLLTPITNGLPRLQCHESDSDFVTTTEIMLLDMLVM